jgi:hypothetical protein
LIKKVGAGGWVGLGVAGMEVGLGVTTTAFLVGVSDATAVGGASGVSVAARVGVTLGFNVAEGFGVKVGRGVREGVGVSATAALNWSALHPLATASTITSKTNKTNKNTGVFKGTSRSEYWLLASGPGIAALTSQAREL